MVARQLLTLFAALAALLPLAPQALGLAASGALQGALDGQVTVIRGNQLPGALTPPSQPGARCTVVAVAAPLSPLHPGQPFLPARARNLPVIARARCNDQGRFRLVFPASNQATSTGASPSQLTLLLVVPGGYYLNHFDGQGRYASLDLPIAAGHPPIIIRDDRGATY